MWLTSSLSVTPGHQSSLLLPFVPPSFVPAVRNRFDLDGFRLLSWKFRVPISLFPLFCDIVPASHLTSMRRYTTGHEGTMTREKCALRDEITASYGRFVASSPSRLNILGYRAEIHAVSFRCHGFLRRGDRATREIRCDGEGSGTPATRISSLSIFDEATKQDVTLIDMYRVANRLRLRLTT